MVAHGNDPVTMLGASGAFKVLFVYTVIIFISYQVSLAPSHLPLASPRAGPVRHCGAPDPAPVIPRTARFPSLRRG